MKYRSDFVTNSSSSCFVCDTNMSAEEVSEKLHDLMDFYRKFMDDGSTETFEDVFEEPYVYTEDMIPTGKDAEYAWEYEQEETIGKVIIESASDNTIPFSLFEFLEEKFNAKRHHLG